MAIDRRGFLGGLLAALPFAALWDRLGAVIPAIARRRTEPQHPPTERWVELDLTGSAEVEVRAWFGGPGGVFELPWAAVQRYFPGGRDQARFTYSWPVPKGYRLVALDVMTPAEGMTFHQFSLSGLRPGDYGTVSMLCAGVAQACYGFDGSVAPMRYLWGLPPRVTMDWGGRMPEGYRWLDYADALDGDLRITYARPLNARIERSGIRAGLRRLREVEDGLRG